MNLKYFMRGLGIGIILTTLIFTFGNKKEKLTDEEVIKRAETLGMVNKEAEEDNLENLLNNIDVSTTPAPTISPAPISDAVLTPSITPVVTVPIAPTILPTQEPTSKPTEAPAKEPTSKPTEAPTPKPTSKPTTAPAKTPTKAPVKKPVEDMQADRKLISFTITRGMDSHTVAEVLVKSGLIKDADDFNQYIVKIGKANIIRVGTYSLAKGSDYDEIIKAVTIKK